MVVREPRIVRDIFVYAGVLLVVVVVILKISANAERMGPENKNSSRIIRLKFFSISNSTFDRQFQTQAKLCVVK